MFSAIQEDELITFIIGCFVLLYIIVKRESLRSIPSSGTLVFAYCILLAGWLFTLLETFFLFGLMNSLEHFCYMFSVIVQASWCHGYFYPRGRRP